MNKTRKILLVDDMFTIRTFVRGILRTRGFTLIEADNGEQGLELARREQPDLVITDVKMPRMTGIELVKALRAEPTFFGKPVIVLTGERDEAGTRAAALSAGANAFLRKPIDADALQETLAKLLP